MKVVALIPARLNSSRFPKKMLADLCGKPVIVRAYESTFSTGLFDEVYVVTDSDEIEQSVKSYGGKVLRSEKEHETGSDRIAEASQKIDCDIVVNVQGDTPFITKEPLEKLLSVFKGKDAEKIDLASIMVQIKDEESILDPNCVKVVLDRENFALYFSRCPIPYRREKEGEQGKHFKHIGVYAFRKQALLDFASAEMGECEKVEKIECLRHLELGKKIKMVETSFEGQEVNTKEDLEKACKEYREKMEKGN